MSYGVKCNNGDADALTCFSVEKLTFVVEKHLQLDKYEISLFARFYLFFFAKRQHLWRDLSLIHI